MQTLLKVTKLILKNFKNHKSFFVENFNPRPLSEIADKTLKQNQFTGTSTSTPNHKNQKFNDDLDSTLDTSSLILPHQPQPLSENNIPKQEFNISLLTAGFNNLGLVPGCKKIMKLLANSIDL
jgi:hypothetical protein